MNNKSSMFIGLMIGVMLTVVFTTMLNYDVHMIDQEGDDKKTPLYWVAPMDPNYKSNEPGKSPMGMDLIPVYENNDQSDNSTGTIRVSPDVVNNIGVKTASVKKGQLHLEVKTVGFIQFDEDQLIHLHPRVEGWIEKLYIKSTGDPVKKGQALYEIYSPSLVNAQEELLLALNRKNQQLINASKQRLKALQMPESAINSVIKSRKIQKSIVFYSPQSGVVNQLKIRQGMFVKPGTLIMSIGNLDVVWVAAEVFERQAALLSVGAPVSMHTDFFAGKTWHGVVNYIHPTLDMKTRTIKVRLLFENKDNLLKPNMFSHVIIHPSSPNQRLLVPREAVIRTGNQDRVVLALTEGKFKSVAVTVGASDNHFMEIIKGIDEGDVVVTSAQFLLDSESSKTSDFKRMNHQNDNNFATTTGVVNSIIKETGVLNISREPIKKWNRPAATLDFIMQKGRRFDDIRAAMEVEFTFSVVDNKFVISHIKPVLPNGN